MQANSKSGWYSLQPSRIISLAAKPQNWNRALHLGARLHLSVIFCHQWEQYISEAAKIEQLKQCGRIHVFGVEKLTPHYVQIRKTKLTAGIFPWNI